MPQAPEAVVMKHLVFTRRRKAKICLSTSVSDPDTDPPDSHVYGLPGSGSGSFYHQGKEVRKTLIPAVL